VIFADTGAFIALLRQKDRHHRAAKTFLATRPLLVITDYVVDETVTLLLTRVSRDAADHFLSTILQSRFIRLEMVGPEGFHEAAVLFRHHRDKSWSFTDCTSYAVMKRLRLTQAFAFDAHFEQRGFALVPREP
jgi:predicted nucleic acid-binding protein